MKYFQVKIQYTKIDEPDKRLKIENRTFLAKSIDDVMDHLDKTIKVSKGFALEPMEVSEIASIDKINNKVIEIKMKDYWREGKKGGF